MSHSDHTEQFIRLFFAGFGLLFLGGVNLFFQRSRGRVRLAASAGVAAAVLGGYALWESNPGAIAGVATILGVGLVPVLLLGSRRLMELSAAALRFAQKPAARWGVLTAGGIALIVYAAATHSRADEKLTEAGMAEIELLTRIPELAVVDRVPAKTDRGYVIPVRTPEVHRSLADIEDSQMWVLRRLKHEQFVIHRGPADDTSNCHGWVFTGGKYWLTGDAVDLILKDNDYAVVDDPRPGDLAIYRNDRGVSHTAVVRYVSPGQPPIVEGKWAWMGVFLHPVDQSAYGLDFKYYRSSRDGHVIAGLK